MKSLPINPRVTQVSANDNYTLTMMFQNGEIRVFDASSYLGASSFFEELRDEAYFKSAFVIGGTVEWPHGQSFCPDTLYELAVAVTQNQTSRRTA
ncbi:MAG: DUF2442 domain-containing protein [Thermoguttaceae bacterium]